MTDLFSQPLIRDLQPGETVTGFFVLRRSELRTKQDGSPYLFLELGDASGRIQASVWEDAARLSEQFSVGQVVKVEARIRTYKDKHQLNIQRIRPSVEEDGVEIRDLLPRAPLDTDDLFKKILAVVDSVQDSHLNRLLHRLFDDESWTKRFRDAPGGKLWHHAYLGGLMEHTLSVARICDTMAGQYSLINRDLLISGALLHDIGKLNEYGVEQGFIDYTDEGRLWGHIVMGGRTVHNLIDSLNEDPPFPDELKKQLIHLILSHQGKLEHGSPVLPATLEAVILYYADEMDAKTNGLKHVVEREGRTDRRWSPYLNIMDRFIYLAPYSEREKSD
ncbi:MAG TPA: HD domain-containing protein [bacterium]|nr:HD domain-containing protein [bacterium]